MNKLLGVLLFAFLAVGVVRAQAAPVSAPAPAVQAAAVHAPPFDVEAATNAYMAELTPAQRANSDAYFEGGYWLILWDLLVTLGVAWLLWARGCPRACAILPNASPACAGCRLRSTPCSTSCW